MKICVMSDSHDNIPNMRKALQISGEKNVKRIIHCGDFVAPFMLRELDMAGIPVSGVFGNNDGDRHLLTRLTYTELSNVRVDDLFGELELDGIRIGYTHERLKADGLLYKGGYDIVCFGHSHTFFQEKTGGTVLLNPGEILGKDGEPGFCIIDTNTLAVERVLI